jgi:hypothetical protein
MAESHFSRRIHEQVHEHSTKPNIAKFRIDKPLDPSHQAQRAVVTPVKRSIRDDPRPVESEKRKHPVVVDIVGPALDEPSALDAVPSEATPVDRETEEKIMEPGGVVRLKRAHDHPVPITKNRSCRVTITRH